MSSAAVAVSVAIAASTSAILTVASVTSVATVAVSPTPAVSVAMTVWIEVIFLDQLLEVALLLAGIGYLLRLASFSPSASLALRLQRL
jgi:hypothetical protein